VVVSARLPFNWARDQHPELYDICPPSRAARSDLSSNQRLALGDLPDDGRQGGGAGIAWGASRSAPESPNLTVTSWVPLDRSGGVHTPHCAPRPTQGIPLLEAGGGGGYRLSEARLECRGGNGIGGVGTRHGRS